MHDLASRLAQYGAVTLLLYPTTGSASTQITRQVADQPCASCSLTIGEKLRLGDSDGPGVLGRLVTGAKLPGGRYVLSYDANDAEMILFDSSGRFLGVAGRREQGPGEYQFIRWLRSDSSRLYVFDGRLRRVTVLSSDMHFVRTAPLPGHLLGDAEPLGGGLVAVNSNIGSRQAAGLLHLVDDSGSIVRSMAGDSAGLRSDQSSNAWRPLARGRSGSVWLARRSWYRIERWARTGLNELTITRNAAWFRPHVMPRIQDAKSEPEPFIEDLWEDSSGRLWVLVTRSDGQWSRAAGPRIEGVVTAPDRNLFYDTVVEVIDPNTGALLASRRVDAHLTQFLGDGEAMSFTEDKDGIGRVIVWRLQLDVPRFRR